MIFAIGFTPRNQRQRPCRILRGDEPHLAGRIVSSRDKNRAAVMGLADPHAEAELLGLLVKSDIFLKRTPQPVKARPIAAPIIVDLAEQDAATIARPHRLTNPHLGDSLDVLA